MIRVSNKYKEIMNRPVRNRAYISVGIGVVNQNAQEDGKASGTLAYWSYGNVLDTNQSRVEYATMEENFLKADGSLVFVPENDELMQLSYNGITTDNVVKAVDEESDETSVAVQIDFSQIYAIKGITLEFGSAYPTEFQIETAEKTLQFTNDSERFMTEEVLGDTDYIRITPITMVGGQQRFRLKSVLMGVGLQYSNAQIKDFSRDEEISSISEEISSENLSFSFYDEEGKFDVDDDNSFIDYLETMQPVTVSFGLEKDDGTVEWHQVATNYLKDWKSQKGIVTLSATDRLSQMKEKYSAGNRIYERTAYEEAESIFTDAGLEPDEYFIDDYLSDVVIINPMPEATHRECLQILANACRCIIRQDENGRILIKANFANVLDPEDLTVATNGTSTWSKPDNIFVGTSVIYADMTQEFLKADGGMYFLPEDESYLETSYVSEQIADENGVFEITPAITIQMPAAYTYYGVNVDFGGNPPQELVVHTYKSDVLQESVVFSGLTATSTLLYDFLSFDKMVFAFTKGYSNSRVLVNKVSFGSLSDYVLSRQNMLENPVGYKERRVKTVKVKVFSFTEDEDGKVKEVEDEVFVTREINSVGDTKVLQNQLIRTTEQAELLAEWMGNYYANNITYDVNYRGDPRLNAADIIHMESEKKSNLQVEIASHKLSYNGSFSGSLELRRALKMMGG